MIEENISMDLDDKNVVFHHVKSDETVYQNGESAATTYHVDEDEVGDDEDKAVVKNDTEYVESGRKVCRLVKDYVASNDATYDLNDNTDVESGRAFCQDGKPNVKMDSEFFDDDVAAVELDGVMCTTKNSEISCSQIDTPSSSNLQDNTNGIDAEDNKQDYFDLYVNKGVSNRTCRFCGKILFAPSDRKKHEMIHTGEKPHKCTECGACFRILSNLSSHEQNHHGPTKKVVKRPAYIYSCSVCNQVCKTFNGLQTHMVTHSNKKISKPSRSDKNTSRLKVDGNEKSNDNREYVGTRSLVNCTGRKSEPGKAGLCPVCGKIFQFLQLHMQIHAVERPRIFKCAFCKNTYASTSQCKKHQRIHKGYKRHHIPKVCEECGKVMSSKYALSLHIRKTHRDERPFGCSQCGSTFAVSSSYKRHMKIHKRYTT